MFYPGDIVLFYQTYPYIKDNGYRLVRASSDNHILLHFIGDKRQAEKSSEYPENNYILVSSIFRGEIEFPNE